jgi:hypothetical protein
MKSMNYHTGIIRDKKINVKSFYKLNQQNPPFDEGFCGGKL